MANHTPPRCSSCLLHPALHAASSAGEAPQPKKAAKRRRWRHAAVAVMLGGVCALLYAWTLNFPMVFDDAVYLQNNPLVRDASSFGYLSDLHEFVARPAKLGLEPDLATNFILRPVAYATFHWNFLLDGFNPRWYRLFNILMHAGNTLLVYALLTLLLGRRGQGESLSRKSVLYIATTAALLFAVHPLATESVTYIVQRFTSLGTFFYLLTLWLYFLAASVRKRGGRWLLMTAATAVAILGMLTKECAVTAPVMAVVIDWLVMGAALRSALRRALPLLLCLPIIPSLVVLTGWAHGTGELKWSQVMDLTNSVDTPIDHWHYAVTQLTVLAHYLRLLVWPQGLNIDPEWPLYQSLRQGPVLAALAGFVVLVAGTGGWFFRRRQDKRLAVLFVFVVWFFATIAISSGLITLPDLMAEHRTYLPSVGIFAAIACLLDKWRSSGRWGRWLVPAGTVAALVALGCATWQRNEVWSSKVALWQDTAQKSPDKFRVWNNLGEAYTKNMQYEEAVTCFRKTIALEPRCWAAHVNLAGVLNGLAHHQEAFDLMMEMLKANPEAERSVDVRYNVGLAHLGLGRVQQGTDLLKELVTLAPAHRPSHVVLGLVYSQTHHPRKALEQWKLAAALQPADPTLAAMIQKEQVAVNQLEAVGLQASNGTP